MRTSQIYSYVIAAALGVSLSAYVYAGCGSCGGDAGHTHKEAVKKQAKAVCSSCTAAEKPCAKCPAAKKAVPPACGTTACKSACSSKAKAPAEKVKASAHAVKTISTEKLAKVIKTDKNVVILDARSGKYDDGRRIPGAKSLNAKSTPEEVAAVVVDKDAKIVTYCSGVKCPASSYLAKHLTKLGYKNVIEYPKGIAGWSEAGQKVEKAN